jgi:hypothetical protein
MKFNLSENLIASAIECIIKGAGCQNLPVSIAISIVDAIRSEVSSQQNSEEKSGAYDTCKIESTVGDRIKAKNTKAQSENISDNANPPTE